MPPYFLYIKRFVKSKRKEEKKLMLRSKIYFKKKMDAKLFLSIYSDSRTKYYGLNTLKRFVVVQKKFSYIRKVHMFIIEKFGPSFISLLINIYV